MAASYTLYKRQKVANVFTKALTVRQNRNSVQDTDSSYVENTKQDIEKIELHPAHTTFTFHHFRNNITTGDLISIAVKNNDVLAFVNHTTGKSGCASSKLSLSDWWGFIFLAAFPTLICGGIFYNSYSKHGFTSTNMIFLSVGVILVLLIYAGVTNNANARKALKELRKA